MSPAERARIAAHADELARDWPPLTDEQCHRIAGLLRPSPTTGTAAKAA